LRVLVAEMNMRRAGKFEEGSFGHARMWVEARASGKEESRRRSGKERWAVFYIEDMEGDESGDRNGNEDRGGVV